MPDLKISACIPTRGDVDMRPIVDHLRQYPEIDEVMICVSDTPHTRYRLAVAARNEVVYTQDDDCLTDLRPLIDEWARCPREMAFVNAMTTAHAAHYPGMQTLVGFGSIFLRQLAVRFIEDQRWEHDELFYREADRIFATIHPHFSVFPKIEILPYASAPNRYWKQPEHHATRAAMERRIFERTGIRP
jgi:hypothetical protein